MGSCCIVGWELGYVESMLDMFVVISCVIKVYNNVFVMFYLDNGFGYKNKLMNDEIIGFYV